MSDRNPFYGRPGGFITQNLHECDLCGRMFPAAFRSRITICYADQGKIASDVCPECMTRLGFQPRKIIPLDQYERMEDAITQYHRVKEES